MSTKDIAYGILDSLSEEKLEAFITLFADESTIAKFESEAIAKSPNPKLFDSFEDFMKEMDQKDGEI
ncbi:MAG: hypothetical protein IJ060_06465 [Oscillospiraceae bacterium]|nr:hypothetical protein [Oscillospiraceae bacterium]